MAHLLRKGWRIEAHRFRLGHHDLDVIARRGSLVAFVEVKTRSSSRFGRAVEAVGWRKRAVQTRLAELWRARFGFPDDRYRFDVICIERGVATDGGSAGVGVGVGERGRTGFRITHIEDAWRGVDK
jgi:putative endonuclease